MFDRFTNAARDAVLQAANHARTRGFLYVGQEHLLWALARQPAAKDLFIEHGFSMEEIDDLSEDLDKLVSGGGFAPNEVPEHVPYTPGAKKVLEDALRVSLGRNSGTIEVGDLLVALYETEVEDNSLAFDVIDIFRLTSFDPAKARAPIEVLPEAEPQSEKSVVEEPVETVSPWSEQTLGDRMKVREKHYDLVINYVATPYVVLRLDGRAFHNYLRGANKPFDPTFVHDMRQVGKRLAQEIDGAIFAYGQSDEISVLLDYSNPETQPWFGGRMEKMVSVSASIATGRLIQQRGLAGMPQFDSRVLCLPSMAEASSYFLWRQRDALRNTISMAAQHHFSPKQLHGKNGPQMREMLLGIGVNFDEIAPVIRQGWVVFKDEEVLDSVSYVDKRTKELVVVEGVKRRVWCSAPAPLFAYNKDFVTEVTTRAKEEGLVESGHNGGVLSTND